VVRSNRKTSERSSASAGDVKGALLEELPCVVYESTSSYRITSVSENCFDLLGIDARDLEGDRAQWEQKIPSEDLSALNDAFRQLEATGSGSAIHRIVNQAGLPLWVCHSVRMAGAERGGLVRGCIIPIPRERRLQSIDPAVIARFVHKIGNHFQVLSLVISGLKRTLPDARPIEVLDGALEKAVDLTRAFSDFAQGCSLSSRVELAGILGSVALNKRPHFADKGVELHERIDSSVEGVTFWGDAYLMETALNGILQNALEVSRPGDRVVFEATADAYGNGRIARIRVSDRGSGIPAEKLQQVMLPFYTSKTDHEGLGLTMAARVAEMHGGRLQVSSAEGQGTTVDMTLSAMPAPAVDRS
jgi:signal transduction histidine kinase